MGGGGAHSLLVLPDGSFYVGGDFTIAGTTPANYIARWGPSGWSALGAGITKTGINSYGAPVRAIAGLPGGDIVVGGNFVDAGSVTGNGIARWDGTAWHALGTGLVRGSGQFEPVRTLTTLPSGDLVVGGSIGRAGDTFVEGLARWDGQSWYALSSGTNRGVGNLRAVPGGGMIAGGAFSTIGGTPATKIAQWNGRTWSPMGAGLGTGFVGLRTLARDRNGDLLAGGAISTAGGLPVSGLARWNGSEWSGVGGGVSGGSTISGGIVNAITNAPNGDLVVAGDFSTAGDVTAHGIARWDGSTWHPMTPESIGIPRAIAFLPNGDLVAGGGVGLIHQPFRHVARWDGTQWSQLGSGLWQPSGASVEVLLTLPNGDLVVGGNFNAAAGVAARGVARWDGTAWHPMGPGLTRLGNSAHVYDLTLTPQGDIIAAGNMLEPAVGLARWNGTTWSAVGPDLSPAPYGMATDVQVDESGEIVASGPFYLADSQPSAYIARLSETGAPWVALQPESLIAASDTVVLHAASAAGYRNVLYQWYRNGLPITNGPAGASPSGGTVSGASGPLPSPTDATPATLTITGVQPSDAGDYTIVFTNACGEATSTPATLTVTGGPACPPDWNNDTQVNSTDISAFLTSWLSSLQLGDLLADFNTDNVVNSTDISAFLTAWLDAVQHGC